MSISKHLKLSNYVKTQADLQSKQNDAITSGCVVSISNYSWFEKNKDKPVKFLKCQTSDFDISFKLSSTAFATSRNQQSGYHFDKNGVKLTYGQCYSLFRNEIFYSEYIKKVNQCYQRDLELQTTTVTHNEPSSSQHQRNVSPCFDDLEEEKEEDEEQEMPPPPPPPPKKYSIKDLAIKRLKKL